MEEPTVLDAPVTTDPLIDPISEPAADPSVILLPVDQPVNLDEPVTPINEGGIQTFDPTVPLEVTTAVVGSTPDAPKTLTFDVINFTGDEAAAKLTLEEVNGDIKVTVDVIEPQGDIRGVFFNIDNDALLGGLSVSGPDITDFTFGPSGGVSNLKGGDNINPKSFDAGVEIGTPGIGKDDIASTTFTLSHSATDLTLADFTKQNFGVRLTSVGEDDRNGSSKLDGVAPDAPLPAPLTPPPPAPPETLEGTDNSETLVGGGGNDVINGGGGNDTCIGLGGDDVVDGGTGDDQVIGGTGDDMCTGGDGNDVAVTDQGDDTCLGGSGDDQLYGGTGNDTCTGEEGDDIVGGNVGDDFTGGSEGDDTCLGGEGSDSLYGGQDNDTCTGDDGSDVVSGDKGDDFASGNAGDDTCMGGEGDDSVYGGQGDDSATGGAGSDIVSGDAGDDSCSGGTGDDSLMGGDGNDMASGDEGDDSVIGGAGDDSCLGGEGNDIVDGGAGDDSCLGGEGDDSLGAGAGDDTLEGGAGDDSLVVGEGNDIAMGGEGDDTFMGSTGDHTCIGGSGNDSFIVGTGGGKSFIGDFAGGSDKFLLINGLSYESLSFVQINADVEIQFNGTVLTKVGNISANALEQAANFGLLGSDGKVADIKAKGDGQPGSGKLKSSIGGGNGLQLASGSSFLLDFNALRFESSKSSFEIIYKLKALPKGSKLMFKGVEVSAGFSFTQADINLNLVTFEAGAVEGSLFDDLVFDVTDGVTTLIDQKLKISIFQTSGFTVKAGVPFLGSPLDDSIEGSTGDDEIDGDKGDDDIKGGSGKDKIKGGSGKDKISGGKGDDELEGGAGDDELEGGSGKNKLKGGSGKDKFKFSKALTGKKTLADADIILDFNVSEDFLVFDTAAFGNLSIANFTSIEINSSTTSVGNASLLIFDASFTSLADIQARFEQLNVGNRPTFCLYDDASTGGSVLVFSFGARIEIVATFSFKVSLTVGNFLFEGAPLEVPQGTDGADNADFGSFPAPISFYDGKGGNDTINGSDYDDNLLGGAGDDSINGGEGDDSVSGGTGNDTCLGGAGDDTCWGGAGDDSLGGGSGADMLKGGSGADMLSGGAGSDVFVYGFSTEGGDTIVDFKSGEDKLMFSTPEFGNIGSADFNSVTVGTDTDISGGELLIFSGTFASLGDLGKQYETLPGAGTNPVFCFYQNAAGEGVLVFDSDGVGSGAPTVNIANFGSGVTSLGTSDFQFTDTGNTFAAPVPNTTPGGGESIADFSAATAPVIFDYSTAAFPVNVTGSDFADNFTGSAFGNTFLGGSGADILTGGSGADSFVYNAPSEGGDTITDFTSGSDLIQFNSGNFGSLTALIDSASYFNFFADGSTPAQAETGLGSGPAFFVVNDGGSPVVYFDLTGSTALGDFLPMATFGGDTPGASDFLGI